VLYFYIENNTKVAHLEWHAADQADRDATARLIARVNLVALAANPGLESMPDLYDFNSWLWLFGWGGYEIYYTLPPLPVLANASRDTWFDQRLGIAERDLRQDVYIVGFASSEKIMGLLPRAQVDAEMSRRSTLIARI
jgi:hypothetical protein